MTSKTSAVLVSAFVTPGLGHIRNGRKRGWLYLLGIIVVVVFLCFNIFVIVQQEMPPDMLMRLSPTEYAVAFLHARNRVYHENLVPLVVIFGIWLTCIIDILLVKFPDGEEPKEQNPA